MTGRRVVLTPASEIGMQPNLRSVLVPVHGGPDVVSPERPSALCRCGQVHRSWDALARCLYPGPGETRGRGSWLLVHPMMIPTERVPVVTRVLFTSRAEAVQRAGWCGDAGCCGSCGRAIRWGYRSFVVALHEATTRGPVGPEMTR